MIEAKITTFYRSSTNEWVGEINYQGKDYGGTARYTGESESQALNAAIAAVSYHLLETTFADT